MESTKIPGKVWRNLTKFIIAEPECGEGRQLIYVEDKDVEVLNNILNRHRQYVKTTEAMHEEARLKKEKNNI